MDTGVGRRFTVAEARDVLAQIRPAVDRLIVVRAELAELTYALESGVGSAAGGMAERKALEAQFAEGVEALGRRGLQLKGVAPLLLDFPAIVDRREALLCWVGGDPELGWSRLVELGFGGRPPLPAEPGKV